MERRIAALSLILVLVLPMRATAQNPEPRPGVPPADAWTCPAAQPIKGNFTASSGELCVHHVPRGGFYSKTKPERCYATEADAQRDGCRKSKR
jgi:hypothetical protein